MSIRIIPRLDVKGPNLVKVPQVGWNNLSLPYEGRYAKSWDESPMD